MPSFFTSSSPKKNAPVFAGLDDPFNFPSSKMRYNARSHFRTSSPDSANDSGYGSSASLEDLDCPLSPKSQAPVAHKRRLQKKDGQWGLQSYEYQSIANDYTAERQPILNPDSTNTAPRRDADNDHEWKPNLKHTFTLICQDVPAKPKWYASRIYGRALERKEKNEGLTDLQRSMAPVLRRPSPGPRKKSTLLHPSPPEPTTTSTTSMTALPTTIRVSAHPTESYRGRNPSTLLHPSSPLTTSRFKSTSTSTPTTSTPTLRSPRHRSPTPLRIPTTSLHQPTPTPLRIHIRMRRPSVLHSCFSDSESDSEAEEEGCGSDDDDDDDDDGSDGSSDDSNINEPEETKEHGFKNTTERNGVILARSALVARAQRVRVGSPRGVEGWV